jgi:phage protein U
MLASLGLFVFELASMPFGEQQRRRDWRHEAAKRVGARDSAQFVGPGDDLITLSGILAPEAIGSYGSIDTLVEMADEGEIYTFVDGTGRVLGEYAILALDTRSKHLMVDGVPRMVDFGLDLRRVG